MQISPQYIISKKFLLSEPAQKCKNNLNFKQKYAIKKIVVENDETQAEKIQNEVNFMFSKDKNIK